MRALVIGGGSDLGRAIAKALQGEYQVHVSYFSRPVDIPGATGHRVDITDPTALSGLFEGLPPLDLIVTAAFPFLTTRLDAMEDYERSERFLRAHVAIFSEAARRLSPGGKLINLLGQSCDHGLPSAPHYAASFAYLDNLAKSFNARFGREGRMQVHNLQLGPVETSLWSDVSPAEREHFAKRVLDFLRPDEVARMVAELARMRVLPTKLVWDSFFSLPH